MFYSPISGLQFLLLYMSIYVIVVKFRKKLENRPGLGVLDYKARETSIADTDFPGCSYSLKVSPEDQKLERTDVDDSSPESWDSSVTCYMTRMQTNVNVVLSRRG